MTRAHVFARAHLVVLAIDAGVVVDRAIIGLAAILLAGAAAVGLPGILVGVGALAAAFAPTLLGRAKTGGIAKPPGNRAT